MKRTLISAESGAAHDSGGVGARPESILGAAEHV
jgi:hypothetical protein